MVPQFWSHGRHLAVVTRTGVTLVQAGAEAKTQVLYLGEFHRILPKNINDFHSLSIDAKNARKMRLVR